MAMEVVHEDAGDGNMQCTNHPYKNSTAGGICAFCLQEKLGNLVSSSHASAVFPSISPSPPPSVRSSAASAAASSASFGGGNVFTRKSRLPFVLTHKKKNPVSASLIFKRSKSTANYSEDYSPNLKGCRLFFKKSDKDSNFTPKKKESEHLENVGPIDRKVSRSRSVGCGSTSFSDNFFERIPTGRPKMQKNGEAGIKERVKCGGIFSGLMVTTSSSYLIASSSNQENGPSLGHGRSKSWGWAFATPMRAFGKSSAVKKDASLSKNSAPNLDSVPSLLTVS